MKRGLLILVVAIAFGVCGFFCTRLVLRGHAGAHDEDGEFVGEPGNRLPELDWLRRSLGLSDAQFDKVKALHLDYRPKCDQLCERIRAADEALIAASKAGGDSASALTAALRARADVQVECQQAMLAHVRATAACMDAGQAARYLDTVLPYVLGMKSTCCGHPH